MAEAVFAGKKVKEFALPDGAAVPASFDTITTGFPKNLFMRDGPCDAGNGDCQNKKPEQLSSCFHKMHIVEANVAKNPSCKL